MLYDTLSGGKSWTAPAFDHLSTLQHRQLLAIALDVFQAAAPTLANRLGGLRQIPFDRVPPAVPVWVPESRRMLCDLLILVDEPAEAVVSFDLVDLGCCATGEWS